MHRQCKASLKIYIEEAKQINTKLNKDSQIECTLVGNHEKHPQEKKCIENIDNIKNEKDMKELAKALIKKN